MFSSSEEFWFSCLCFHPNSQGKYFKSYCETKDSETFQCEMTVCLILYCFNKHVYKEEIFYSFIKCMHFIQFMPFLLTVTGTLPWRHTLYTVSSGAEWRPHALEKMYSGLQDTITEWHIQAMNHMKQHIMPGQIQFKYWYELWHFSSNHNVLNYSCNKWIHFIFKFAIEPN